VQKSEPRGKSTQTQVEESSYLLTAASEQEPIGQRTTSIREKNPQKETQRAEGEGAQMYRSIRAQDRLIGALFANGYATASSAFTALVPISTCSTIWDTCYANPTLAKSVLFEDHSDVGQLDYALFLYAFIQSPNEARNAQVKEITDKLIDKARKLTDGNQEMQVLFNKGKTSFDGSYKSLVNVMRILSCSGLVNTHASFYAIPCPVVQGRPELLEATMPCFGNSLDERLPRCGLWYGRGSYFCYRRAARFLPLNDIDNYSLVLRNLASKLGRTSFDETRIKRVYERMIFKRHELFSSRGAEFMAAYKKACAEQSYNGWTYAQLLLKVHEISYSQLDERIANCPEFKAAFEQAKAKMLEIFKRDKFDHSEDREDLAVNTLYALAFAHGLMKNAN
jgi:hypothetical protein